MDKEIFKQNIEWNIDQIAVQFAQAENVKGRAKSGFYKAAVVLAASVVEALSFRFLEENSGREMPLEDWCCVESTLLPEKYCADGAQLSICKRIRQKFQLKKHTDFKKVNEICKKLSLFSEGFFHRIEKIRELRNKIHIQGLDNTDRSYTKKDLEFISSVMAELLGKLKLS